MPATSHKLLEVEHPNDPTLMVFGQSGVPESGPSSSNEMSIP